jgi:hypothetical protein
MRLHSRTKLILAALVATCSLGLAVGSATAGRLSTTNTRFRVTWNSMRFADPTGESSIQMSCRVTLEGSFHSSTIRKIAGALIGSITRGAVDSNNCRGTNEPHRITVLAETLPWHLTYESFAGTLPNITSVTFLVSRYSVQFSSVVFGITAFCLYRDAGRAEENVAETATRNTATGAITVNAPVGGRRASFFRGTPIPEACPAFGEFSGGGEVFLLGSTNRISVTLI